MAGLYIHVPFCVRRCFYCAFYLEPLGAGPISSRLRDYHRIDNTPFLDALETELRGLPAGFAPETIFLGGGTPNELSAPDFNRLFDMIRARLDVGRVAEWSCECNPGTLTPEKMDTLARAGVSRVSLGVQSFDARTLEFLGRLHSAEEAREAFRELRRRGFANLNVDLIFSIPVAERAVLENDLRQVLALEPDHVSCYSLEFDEGSPITDLRARGFIRELDPEESAAQYELVKAAFRGAGFHHYELFNFARPGYECRHHLNYWMGGEYYGCGPSAHSHVGGVRWENVRSVEEYSKALAAGRSIRSFEERLEPEPKAREVLVTQLRMVDGVGREEFRRRTGYDYRDLGGEALRRLCADGLLEDTGDRLRLTERAMFISNSVLADLV